MKKSINFSKLEIKQLIIWAEKTIHGGHYGDMDVVIPEEDILLKKLSNMSEGELVVSESECKVMKIWCENAIGESSRGIISEEQSLIQKLIHLSEPDR